VSNQLLRKRHHSHSKAQLKKKIKFSLKHLVEKATFHRIKLAAQFLNRFGFRNPLFSSANQNADIKVLELIEQGKLNALYLFD